MSRIFQLTKVDPAMSSCRKFFSKWDAKDEAGHMYFTLESGAGSIAVTT